MAADPLTTIRKEVGLRIAEIRRAGSRLSPLDLHARMDAIRQLAATNGLAALEGLARHSAQLAYFGLWEAPTLFETLIPT